MNASSSSILVFFTCSLQLVLLVTYIIILGVLLFFKMYRNFIYHLVLYALVAGIISLITLFAYLPVNVNIQNHHEEFDTNTSIYTFLTV